MSASRVFGIDLGTTYSCIAYVDEAGKAVVIPNEDNELVTPSVVYFESPTNVIVGKIARETARVHPDLVVELVKRSMGDSNHRRLIHGKEYRPEEVSALILRKLKEDAERQLGETVTDAVITVPAYFNEAQRTATEQAGKLAGLNVRGIIPEPTAAAVAYALHEARPHHVLVYDLGGGTFDVTVMEIGENVIRVVCIGGDHDLGGRNWDDLVVAWFSEQWKAHTGRPEEPLDDPETAQEFLNIAEQGKRRLKQMAKVPLSLSHAGEKVRLELTREKFDELTGGLLERTIAMTRDALAEAEAKGVTKIERIILVGGSTYMPQVATRLKSAIGLECELFDPDQAVGKGATIYASNKRVQDAARSVLAEVFGVGTTLAVEAGGVVDIGSIDMPIVEPPSLDDLIKMPQIDLIRFNDELSQRLPDVDLATLEAGKKMRIVNACSKNFGVVVLDEFDREIVAYMIHKNDQVPARIEREFYTHHDGQDSVEIRIIEAEGVKPSPAIGKQCREIKTATLQLPPGLPRGWPIVVDYSLSEDGGRLHVVAADKKNGRRIDVQVQTVDALTTVELEEKRGELLKISVQ